MELINNGFVNEVNVSNDILDKNIDTVKDVNRYNIINAFMKEKEVQKMLSFIKSQNRIPVGIDGIKDNYKEGDQIGSYRLSFFNENIAEQLWSRISHLLSNEFDKGQEWKPTGINPLFRVIEYKPGCELVPHYDAPYCYNEKKKTRKSMVIYLTNNQEGATEFMLDDQSELDEDNKDFSDRIDYKSSAIAKIFPQKGACVFFDHRLLHRVEPIFSEDKVIIRTDIVYEQIQE